MIYTTQQFIQNLNNEYSQPINHIAYLLKTGQLFQLKRGLYSDSEWDSKYEIANRLVEGTYVSFETALSFYGLIPEHTPTIVSASNGLRKTKTFTNKFGTFVYKDVHYSKYEVIGLCHVQVGTYGIAVMATKEQALIDLIGKAPICNNVEEMEKLLFEYYRINEILFNELNFKFIKFVTRFSKSKNLKILGKFINGWEKQQHEYERMVF